VVRQPYVVLHCARLRGSTRVAVLWVDSVHVRQDEEQALEVVKRGLQPEAERFQPCKGSQALAVVGSAVLLKLGAHEPLHLHQGAPCCLLADWRVLPVLVEWVVWEGVCSATLFWTIYDRCRGGLTWMSFVRMRWSQSAQQLASTHSFHMDDILSFAGWRHHSASQSHCSNC
jgi:hypothetical protein